MRRAVRTIPHGRDRSRAAGPSMGAARLASALDPDCGDLLRSSPSPWDAHARLHGIVEAVETDLDIIEREPPRPRRYAVIWDAGSRPIRSSIRTSRSRMTMSNI